MRKKICQFGGTRESIRTDRRVRLSFPKWPYADEGLTLEQIKEYDVEINRIQEAIDEMKKTEEWIAQNLWLFADAEEISGR